MSLLSEFLPTGVQQAVDTVLLSVMRRLINRHATSLDRAGLIEAEALDACRLEATATVTHSAWICADRGHLNTDNLGR